MNAIRQFRNKWTDTIDLLVLKIFISILFVGRAWLYHWLCLPLSLRRSLFLGPLAPASTTLWSRGAPAFGAMFDLALKYTYIYTIRSLNGNVCACVLMKNKCKMLSGLFMCICLVPYGCRSYVRTFFTHFSCAFGQLYRQRCVILTHTIQKWMKYYKQWLRIRILMCVCLGLYFTGSCCFPCFVPGAEHIFGIGNRFCPLCVAFNSILRFPFTMHTSSASQQQDCPEHKSVAVVLIAKYYSRWIVAHANGKWRLRVDKWTRVQKLQQPGAGGYQSTLYK